MTSTSSAARVSPNSFRSCDLHSGEELATVAGEKAEGEHERSEHDDQNELNVVEGPAGAGEEQSLNRGDEGQDLTMEVEEVVCEPCEVRVPKSLFDPMLPTPQEVEDHNITHCPPRRWCKICVQGSGKEHPHLRLKKEDRSGLPQYGMDYDHYGDIVEGEDENVDDKVTTMVSKDRNTGMLWGNVIEAKGASDTWIVKRQLQNVELLGRANILCKTDGEPAIVQVQAKMIASRDGQTVPPTRLPTTPNPMDRSRKARKTLTAFCGGLSLHLRPGSVARFE